MVGDTGLEPTAKSAQKRGFPGFPGTGGAKSGALSAPSDLDDLARRLDALTEAQRQALAAALTKR